MKRNDKLWLYRSLALLLTLIFSLNIICYPHQVMAADSALTANHTRSMIPGTDNSIPQMVNTRLEEQVFLSWPMDNINGSSFTHGTHRLSYFIDNQKRIEFIVQRNGNNALVWYDVRTVHGAVNQSITPRGYQVHSNVNSHGRPNFIPIGRFLEGGYNIDDPEYQVLSDPTVSPSALMPQFIIKPDTGFSFTFDDAEVHFLWNSADQSMNFVTNQMLTGRIFDMTLDFTQDVSLPPDFTTFAQIGRQRVLTGISPRRFRSIPFANDGNTAGRGTGNTGFPLDIDEDLRANATFLDMGENGTDDPPGTPENEIILRFDVPKEYDTATGSFSRLPDGPLLVDLELENPDPRKEIQILEIDIRSNESTTHRLRPPSGAIIKRAGVVNEAWVPPGDRFEVHLGNLEAGILFTNVRFSLTGSGIVPIRNDMPFGRVFTFLNYRVVSQDGRFFVRVEPYPELAGFYMLMTGQHPLERSVTMFSDGRTPLMMPMTISSGATGNQWESHYQVLFSPGRLFTENISMDIFSQELRYRADNRILLDGVPNEFRILNYRQIMRPGAENSESDVEFTARWEIGNHHTILELLQQKAPDPLVIEYQLFKSLTPNNPNPDPLFEIFTATITASGGALTTSGEALYVQFADTTGNILNTDPIRLELGFGPTGDLDTYFAEVTFRATAAITGMTADFIFPNVFFLAVERLSPMSTNRSLFDSLTLNDLSNLELPPPQNLTVGDPITTDTPPEVSFRASFVVPGAQILSFLETHGFDPDVVRMNLYISESEEAIRQLMAVAPEERRSASIDVPYEESYGDRLNFSPINEQSAMAISGFGNPRDALRDGKIVQISDILLTPPALRTVLAQREPIEGQFTLDGMDKNQRYFLCMDIIVKAENGAFSRLSNIVGITTIGDFDVPDMEAEKVPPAPVVSIRDIGTNMATLIWNRILPLSADDRNIEYEIIRLRNEQLNPALLSTRRPFEAFFAESLPQNADKVGWRTNQGRVEGYDGTGFTLLDDTKTTLNSTFNPIEFSDFTISPNQLYFYYVRTVRVLADRRVVSVWSRVNATSSPVDKPKHLRAEQDAEFDRMREVVISFDAPIMDPSLLGSAFDLQYQLRKGSEDWQDPVTMRVSGLTEITPPVEREGHRRFKYTITGLESGSVYTIRVRMIDESGIGSIFTDPIQIRTDINQRDFDNNNTSTEWIDFIRNILNELLKSDFWTLRNAGNAFEVVYRPDMLEGLIRAGAAPVLLAESDARFTTYYLPASAITAINAAGKGIRIPHRDMEILLSPNALDGNYNDAIRSAMDKVKTGHIEDYFIRICIEWSNPVTHANVENRRADVEISAVGSRQNISDWNDEMLRLLSDRIAAEVADDELFDIIKRGVERGHQPERLVQFTDRVKAHVQRELDEMARRNLRPTLRFTFPLNRLEEPMIVISKNLDPRTVTDAFRFDNSGWVPRNVMNFGDDRAVSEKELGSYVFSGQRMDIPGLEGSSGAGTKNAIAAKYHLGDFFSGSARMTATRFSIAGAAARIAGAPREAEPFAWLSENVGLPLSTYGPANPIAKQEVVHILMSLYAYRTRTDLASIVRRDFSMPALTEGIRPEYISSVKAAYSIGLLSGDFAPNEWMSVGEALELLRRLDEKIGF